MTTLREAAQQALEALEESEQHYGSDSALRDAIQILRTALEQPEQEPVAWMDDFGNAFPLGAVKGAGSWRDDHQRNWIPLYTQPPRREWQGLTDEEIESIWDGYLSDYQLQMIRDIEDKLKERNA